MGSSFLRSGQGHRSNQPEDVSKINEGSENRLNGYESPSPTRIKPTAELLLIQPHDKKRCEARFLSGVVKDFELLNWLKLVRPCMQVSN